MLDDEQVHFTISGASRPNALVTQAQLEHGGSKGKLLVIVSQ
jgi:hypothetical protein